MPIPMFPNVCIASPVAIAEALIFTRLLPTTIVDIATFGFDISLCMFSASGLFCVIICFRRERLIVISAASEAEKNPDSAINISSRAISIVSISSIYWSPYTILYPLITILVLCFRSWALMPFSLRTLHFRMPISAIFPAWQELSTRFCCFSPRIRFFF